MKREGEAAFDEVPEEFGLAAKWRDEGRARTEAGAEPAQKPGQKPVERKAQGKRRPAC
jgi:hypothetical protein